MCVVCNSSTTGETFFLVGRARTGEGRDNVNEKNNVVRCSMMMMMMTVGITHGNRRILTYHHSRPERWETVRRRRPTIPSQRSTTVGEKGSIWMAGCRHVSKKKMTYVYVPVHAGRGIDVYGVIGGHSYPICCLRADKHRFSGHIIVIFHAKDREMLFLLFLSSEN